MLKNEHYTLAIQANLLTFSANLLTTEDCMLALQANLLRNDDRTPALLANLLRKQALHAGTSANLLKKHAHFAGPGGEPRPFSAKLLGIPAGGEMKTREFGVRLTQLRERRQLSVARLASLIGVDYMQVSRYEKGQTLPSLEPAARLAQVLEVSLDELVSGREPSEPPLFRNARLLERMRQLDALPADRQELALRVLDTVIAGYELEDLGKRLRRS